MKREDIIRMAREAGFESNSLGVTYTSGWLPDLLERFAALVAYKAKEEMLMAGNDEWLEEARRHEREECAKLFESHWRETWTDEQCAAAIRASGSNG